ncbi:MAG: hypothetical protein SGBAC_010300 [Bacillariaceae sp.]
MTASAAMTNYFQLLRQREDFESFEIVMDNPRTFCCAPPPEAPRTKSPKEAKAEKRWSQSFDLSAAPGLVAMCDAPFIPQRRLSMDVNMEEDEQEEQCKSQVRSNSPVRPPTPRMTRRRKSHKQNESVNV